MDIKISFFWYGTWYLFLSSFYKKKKVAKECLKKKEQSGEKEKKDSK